MLYKQYLQGGLVGHGLIKNELLLKRAQRSSDPTKWLADCPLGVNKIPIILIVWISLVHWYPLQFLNLILWKMYMFNNCHLVLVICYLCYFKVAWSWKKIFVLMASGILNATHPNLQFNVFTLQKTRLLKCKAKINIYKSVSGTLALCYLGFWVE
jgi:hypothetical protein